MKKLFLSLFTLVFVLLVSGCYESEIPLSKNPTSKTDSRLIGSWISIQKQDLGPDEVPQESTNLLVQEFSENEYLIVWKEGEEENTVIKRGFSTKIDNINMVNLQDVQVENSVRTFNFAKYEINTKGNLVVSMLTDDSDYLEGKKFRSPKDLYKFVQSIISNEGLFDKSIEFEPSFHDSVISLIDE